MYINLSKKYTEDPKNYEHYIDVKYFDLNLIKQKAEQVDMSYCQEIKEFRVRFLLFINILQKKLKNYQ